MVGARVENKIEKLMRQAHKILKEWIQEPRASETRMAYIPVIIKK